MRRCVGSRRASGDGLSSLKLYEILLRAPMNVSDVGRIATPLKGADQDRVVQFVTGCDGFCGCLWEELSSHRRSGETRFNTPGAAFEAGQQCSALRRKLQ